MDDRQRAQGLRAISKVASAAEVAVLELEDIITNGCACPDTVRGAIESLENVQGGLKDAHRAIRTAHIVRASKEQGSPLPFPEGEEATHAPKGRKKKAGKDVAAGPDAE